MTPTEQNASCRRLLVMDIDSTLIDEEVIDLLGDASGHGEEIAAITERAMRGEIDFREALRERVALLKGLPDTVFHDVIGRTHFTTGALDLIDECHRRGWTVGVVSGGFHEVADELARRAHIDHCLANALVVRDGLLTGEIDGNIVTKESKLAALTAWAAEDGVPMDRTIAIGDGANDIPMILAAGTGIAFCAKPIVRQTAPHSITTRDLRLALPIIDGETSR
ncbi:MAG: phosphoserine phosphatase SerB [Pseudoscardovia radai]|nr:phosphoserine phosphatase SerB [Pseudoscardovia radai]